MPTSNPFQLNEIVYLAMQINPKSVLDIGAGFGKYGVLMREYLELWDGREKYGDWQRKIDAIEGFEKYLTPLHKFIYNKIYTGNALEILPTFETNKYDLILLIDVLEHFETTEGKRLLQECSRVGKAIIISTPKHPQIQTDSFGNPYETHLSKWDKKSIRNCLTTSPQSKTIFFIPDEDSIIGCLITDFSLTGEITRKKLNTIRMKIIIRKYFPLLRYIYHSFKGFLSRK